MKYMVRLPIVFGVAITLLSGCTSTHQVTRWQYHKEYNLSQRDLDELGEHGWRLVGFGMDHTASPAAITYVLERPKK